MVVSSVASSTLHYPGSIITLDSTRGGSIGILPYHSVSTFNHPWTYQVSYVFPPATLVPLVLSKFLVKHVSHQFRLLILVAPCWLPGFSQFSTCWSTFFVLPCHKRSHHGCFGRQGAQESAYLHLTFWLLRDVCCADKGSLLPSVRQWWGNSSV